MNPTREEALFAAALERPATERAAFLDGACLGDAGLRARVESLLASHDATANPLATRADPGPTIRLQFAEAPDEAVGQTLGRYKLLEQIGEGGCGVAYVAEQTEPVRRRVALKVIKLGMDTKSVVARFEAERQALAMMDHPNIAKVLDAGTTDKGRPYFVMELVRGIRITDYCDQKHLAIRDRLDLFIKVCQAIQHAHQKGIIHRDIKPSNILVTLHDGVPVPKVIDFGIAKATEGRLTDATVYTQLHQFIGTPAYMSPEQAEMSGLDIDTRSDIYSLGVLLYELLTGVTPFDGKELMASGIDGMRKTIREKEPVRPSTRLTQIAGASAVSPSPIPHSRFPSDLDWIAMKCLEKDRTRRYETASGLATDLKRHLDNEPVAARPPSAAYRFRKMVTRHKAVSVAVAAVVFGLVSGVGFSTYAFVRERQAFRALLESERRAAVERARFAVVSGDMPRVEEVLREAAAKGVAEADRRLLRGQFLVASGLYQEAVDELRPLLDADPNRVAVLGLFAAAYAQVNWSEYELLLPRLRAARPVSADDHLFLGQALAVMAYTEPQWGLELIEKAVSMQDSPMARVILADARINHAAQSARVEIMEAALREVAAAEAWSPNSLPVLVSSCRAHTLAARLFERIGQAERAAAERQMADARGRRLEAFYPSTHALSTRLYQLEDTGAEEEARTKAREWATDLPKLRSLCVWMEWEAGDFRTARELRGQWPDAFSPNGLIGFLLALDPPEARSEAALFRGNMLKTPTATLAHLYGSYTVLTLQGTLAEAQAFARSLRPAYQEKVASLGPHFERVLQFACGDLSEEDFLRQSGNMQAWLAEAHFLVGLSRLAAGERAQAEVHFATSIHHGSGFGAVQSLAKGALHRLRIGTTWPPAREAPTQAAAPSSSQEAVNADGNSTPSP